MKKLLILLLFIPFLGISQTLTGYKGLFFEGTQYLKAPYIRLNTTNVYDTANTSRSGALTKYQFYRLNTAFANIGTYKLRNDSTALSGYWTNYKASRQWVTSSSNIYKLTGSVGIGTNSPTYNLDVLGTQRLVMPDNTAYSFKLSGTSEDDYLSINTGTTGKNIVVDETAMGVKFGIGKIPTTTLDVNGSIQSNSNLFLNSPSSVTFARQLYWNNTDKTLNLNIDTINGVTGQLFQEQMVKGVNKTLSTINDGQALFIDGAQGNRPKFNLAISNDVSKSRLIAVATQNIANNDEGFGTTFGLVRGFNTSTYTAGDKLYLSPSSSGGLTKTMPKSPNYVVEVATALNSTNNGDIFVNPQAPLAADTTMSANSNAIAPTQRAVKQWGLATFALKGSASQWTTTGNNIQFPNNTNNYYVGIGTSTTTIAKSLHIFQDEPTIRIQERVFSHYWDLMTEAGTGDYKVMSTTYPDAIHIKQSNGYLGINTDPSYQLDVSGTSRFGTTSNYTSTDADGTLKMVGDATVFDDLMFPFETGTNATNPYPTFDADSLYYNWVVDTTGVAKCIMYFVVQMPHSWKDGSTIFPHVHYKHETTPGTPTFKIKYKWYNSGATTNQSWKWYSMPTTTGTTNATHQMAYRSTGISGTGKTISSILVVQLYLSAQTGTGNIHAWQMDIHYEKDQLGSKTETSK